MYLSKEGAHSDAVFEPRSAVAAIRTFWSPQSASARGLDLGAHESLGAEYACGGFWPGQLGLITLSTYPLPRDGRAMAALDDDAARS